MIIKEMSIFWPYYSKNKSKLVFERRKSRKEERKMQYNISNNNHNNMREKP